MPCAFAQNRLRVADDPVALTFDGRQLNLKLEFPFSDLASVMFELETLAGNLTCVRWKRSNTYIDLH